MSIVAACFPVLAENLLFDSSLLDALTSSSLLTQLETDKLSEQDTTNEQKLELLLGPDSPLAKHAVSHQDETIGKLCAALCVCGRETVARKLQKVHEGADLLVHVQSEAAAKKLHCVVKSTLQEKYDDVKFGMASVYIQAMGVRSRKEISVAESFVENVPEVPDEDGVATMRVDERTAITINMPFGSGSRCEEKKKDILSQIAVVVTVKDEQISMFRIPTSRGCCLGVLLPGGAALDLMRLVVKPGGLDCLTDVCVVPVVEVSISQLPPVNVSFSHHGLREVAPGVVLMGEAGVGKSSIIKQLVADSEAYLHQSTAKKWMLPEDVLVSQRGGMENGFTALHICEIPGMDAIRRSLTSSIFNHLSMAAGVVFVFSVNSGESLFAAHDCLEEARLYAPSEAQFFLMGNKTDLPSQIADGKVTSFARQSGIAAEHVFMVSSQNEQGVRDAFSTISAAVHTVQLEVGSTPKEDSAIGPALEKCRVS